VYLLITGVHGNVFRNELVSKNPSLRKRVCHSFPTNGSTCHNIIVSEKYFEDIRSYLSLLKIFCKSKNIIETKNFFFLQESWHIKWE
jgi:hypothetical protein